MLVQTGDYRYAFASFQITSDPNVAEEDSEDDSLILHSDGLLAVSWPMNMYFCLY